MKKHIIGLTLFSLIVSAAAIVYAVFNVPDVILRPAKLYKPAEKTSCRLQRKPEQENTSPKITQAVYNVKTNTLNWEMNSLDFDTPTVLHWFVENKNGIENVQTIYVNDLSGQERVISQTELGKMLKKFPKSNHYLIANTDSKNTFTDTLNDSVKFDASKAFPVTIDYGK